MNKLLRFDDNVEYLLFDVESSHLNLLHDNFIWQLGFIVFNNKEILEKHQYYVKHDNFKISDDAARVTRFNWDVYNKNAQPQKEIFELFEKYLYDPRYIVLGHNILGFDVHLLLQWRRINNLRANWSYLNRLIDTNCVGKAIKLGMKSIKSDERLEMMFKLSNFFTKGMKTNLTALGKEYGISSDLVNYDELHCGINDCILNHYVWQKMKYMIDI